jgi:exonuclease V
MAHDRFLNMLSALEALLTLGKCRELPVVGFVKGVLVIGVIVSPHI